MATVGLKPDEGLSAVVPVATPKVGLKPEAPVAVADEAPNVGLKPEVPAEELS
jgi:hypothetical protein